MADILMDDNQAKTFKDTLIEAASEEFANNIYKANLDNLKSITEAVINMENNFNEANKEFMELQELTKKWNAHKQKIAKSGGIKDLSLYEELQSVRENINQKKNSEEFQRAFFELYEACLQYQNIINLILNKQVVTVFAFQNKGENGVSTKEVAYSFNFKEFKENLRIGYDTQGKLVLRLKNNFNINNRHRDNIKNIQKNDKLEQTRKEVENRFEIGNKYRKKRGAFIFWRIKSSSSKGRGAQWRGALISSRGSIAEAYIAFLIDNKFTPTNVYEGYIDRFMTDELNGVIQVDNMPGLYQGDKSILLNNKEEQKDLLSIEVSVKSDAASLMKIQQYIESAKKTQQFLAQGKNLDQIRSELKKIINQQENDKHFINKYYGDIKEETEKEAKNMLTKIKRNKFLNKEKTRVYNVQATLETEK